MEFKHCALRKTVEIRSEQVLGSPCKVFWAQLTVVMKVGSPSLTFMFRDAYHKVHVYDLVWALHIACYKLQLLTLLAAYHASDPTPAVMQC